MRNLTILSLFILFFFSCSSKPEKQKTTPVKKIVIQKKTRKYINVKNLRDFFKRCQIDIENAKKVILDKDIIKNLSHLLKMGHGGKKYYLLERENISKVIEAVTVNVYSDFILINKKGTVIYTRRNNSIFNKNVRTHLKDTALNKCYTKRNNDINIEDVQKIYNDFNPDGFFLFVSTKVKGGNTFPGIFVLQVDIEKIMEHLKKETSTIGHDGKFKVSHTNEILSYYREFNKINLKDSKKENKIFKFTNSMNKITRYRFFNFKNLEWVVISE